MIMRNKVFMRIVAVILAILILGSILFGVLGSLAGATASQSALDALKDKESQLSQQKQDIQSQINSLQYEQMAALAKKAVLDEQVELTQDEIDNLTEQIAAYTVLIEEKAGEVVQAQAVEDEQWENYKVHIRAMEEAGSISYIGVIFEASSFADLLGRLDFVAQIMNEDERQYQKLVEAKEATQAAKLALEETKAEQEAEKPVLEAKKAELEDKVAESAELLAQMESSLETYQALSAEIDAQSAAIEADIAKMNEELERQKQDSLLKGTGSFIWPCPSCTIVTSTFGMRMHPIYHIYKLHTGVDIGASYGSNVIAADSGTVAVATYNSSYGNYIVINHGNGYTTLYAHLSKFKVSVNDEVSQGDVIGLVGSTGASTAPHLHFEIRDNGTCIDPLDFFTGYTIS